jgi:DNA-binding NarL/FixJ family response regulator
VSRLRELDIWLEDKQLGPVRIVVVDDFEPWRRSIVSILKEDPEIEVIYQAIDGLEAVEKCEELQPDLVVLDVGLPKLNGLEAARLIREVSPNSKILFLSTGRSRDVILEAVQIGAAGYLLKENAGLHLLHAVRAAILGEEFLQFTVLPENKAEPPKR